MSAAILAAVLLAQNLAERPAVMPLSLKRAVEIAAAPEGNARVQIASELIKQSEARVTQARSTLLPNFDAVVSYSSNTRNLAAFGLDFSRLSAFPGFSVSPLAGPFNVFDARFSGTQSILDVSNLRRFQAARTLVQATKAEAQGTRDQVTDQVARAYLAALRANASVETAKANIELSENLVKLATNQRNAGTGTGIEITRAQVQLANDRQRLTVAMNERERAHLQLARLLGVKLNARIELTDRMEYKPMEVVPEDRAIQAAVAGRPELKAQQERETGARMGYSATKWERLPSAAFFGDYGTIGGGTGNSLPTRTYGVSVRVPLFDGGRRDARRAEAASRMRTEAIRSRDLKEQIELEVRLSTDALRSADGQVAAAREGLSLAERELEQARRRYEAGVATSIELTDAQTRLQRARDNQIQALFAHNLARIDFNSAMGTIQDLVNSF